MSDASIPVDEDTKRLLEELKVRVYPQNDFATIS